MKSLITLAAAVLGIACVALGVVAAIQVPEQTQITKSNFDRIEMGMAFQEVQSILGEICSYSKDARGRRAVWFRHGSGLKNSDDEGLVIIDFDPVQDRAVAANWVPNPDFVALSWSERASLHYGLARFHCDNIALLALGVFLFPMLILVLLRRHIRPEAPDRSATPAFR